MSWKPILPTVQRAAVPRLAVLVTCLCFVSSVVVAQTEEVSPPDEMPDTTSVHTKPLEPSVRAGFNEAQHILESALSDENGNIRWAALRASRGLTSPWIADVVVPLCTSPNLIERVVALEVVANTDPNVGRSAFLGALSSGDRSVRLRGVLGLAALGDEEAVPHLANILRDDPDPDLRAEAARAMAEIDDPAAAIPLYEALESPYAPVREQAVRSLLAIGERGVGDYLAEMLRQDRDPGQGEILRLLALVPDTGVVDEIVPSLEHPDPQIRALAAAAVISIVERSRSRRR